MPALNNTNATVLVTGANGFVGAWIVKKLLEQGCSVRAAVRTESRGQHLLDTNNNYGGRLQIVAIGDIAKDGAFDEGVRGVEAIIHTASPVTLVADEPKELIEPAVNGAVGILASALKNGSSVQRIIIASSFAAATTDSDVPVTVTENSWNDSAIKDCEENGTQASQLSKYAASKTLAEKAVWAFFEKHKPQVNWDITVLNPPWIFGPVVQEVTTAETLNASCKTWYDILVKGEPYGDLLTSPDRGWIDVRDVADAHILALQIPAAGGERILISNKPFVWQDMIDVANSMSPKPYHTLAKGTPGAAVRKLTINTEKEHRILGLRYKTAEELVRDAFANYAARGW
ncbi:D-lactaldehyde dehydrogenase [Neolentinus lepideus HHB14362 ss-1]|uniref:D-lactaldehyde dehydrogenase n=1 Tax=Neolentinus lepideus HHB14362 ss-1 TaxID=1314782 RepID=A0A165VNP3_9AGAM|nr:D-lactaldehyde dehydrogenase [Neolentinus lepideus HHB14362 ss-1]